MGRRIFGMLTLMLLIFQLFACDFQKSDESMIEARIDEFTTAYNSGDWDGVMKCLDSKTRNTCESLINLSESIGGAAFGVNIKLSDLFSIGVGLIPEDEILRISIVEVIIENEESATVDANLQFNDSISDTEETVTISMVKENGDWYIKNMQ